MTKYKTKPFRPGQAAPASGQYKLVGPRGGNVKSERTVVRGEPFPPTPQPKMKYVLADKTKH